MVKTYQDAPDKSEHPHLMYVEPGDLIRYNVRGAHWVDGSVIKLKLGRVQIRLQNGTLMWIESSQVKEKLRTRAAEDEEDGDSTTDSESADSSDDHQLAQQNMMNNQAHTHLGVGLTNKYHHNTKKRDRSVSTAVNNSGENKDVYDQLKDQWTIGSIVECWSETGKKYVVAKIHEIEELQDDVNETILILRYLVENEDESITTLRKKVFASSDSIRPFVNKSAEEDLDELREERDILFQKVSELSEVNDEFLLTIDHQSQTMEQLQIICEDLNKEKDDLNEDRTELSETINTQQKLILDLQEQIEALLETQGSMGMSDVDDDIE